MTQLYNISSTEIDNKPSEPDQNIDEISFDQLKISCEHVRYKRCISILVCIILIPIAITVPTILVQKGKMKTDTIATITTTTAVPLYGIITNTTKWKQNGITIFRQLDVDESDSDFNPMYIDDDETIYIGEINKDRVIALKLNVTNLTVVAGGNGDGDGTHQLSRPIDIIVDKKTDSIFICDLRNRIVRWSRQNATNGDIVISNIYCNGLAMDDKGYLYVSDWWKYEVRQWEIGVNPTSTIVAGGNGVGNDFGQLRKPACIFVDKDYSVYVLDQGNNRVMKWMRHATEGIVVAGGNGAGATLIQLSNPSGMIVDHLGNVYITDTNNDRVMRWIDGAKNGSIVVGGNGRGNETNQLYLPSDLLFDKNGNLYVFDSINHRIQKFDIESN